MARLFKPSTTRYEDANGKRCNKGDPGARKMKPTKSGKWRGEYRDTNGITKSISLCSNKVAARRMLKEIEDRVDLEKAGLSESFEESAKTPLSQHVDEFEANLRDADRTEDHCKATANRVRRIINECRFTFMSDLSPSKTLSWIGERKRNDEMSDQTARHYRTAIKQFSKWLVKDGRTKSDRLAHLELDKGKKVDPVHERRELTQDELAYLLDATRTGPVRSKLTGGQRFKLYLVAMSTGLRASELASLTPKSFDLEAAIPVVTVAPKDEKARRGATLPLPPHIVELLKEWFKELGHTDTLWPGKWAKHKQAGRFLKKDLAAAREAWLNEVESSEDQTKREQSPVLLYETEEGFADFHALRHTFLSQLSRAGAPAKVMQKMARHSTIAMTLERYTHANQSDLYSAVRKLPEISGNAVQTNPSAAQQTAASGHLVAGLVAGVGDNSCESVRSIEENRPFPRASL
jgi:integrase/recombinase XerD